MVMKTVPHGFIGESLIVVPRSAVKSLRSHPLLRGLHVTDAGFYPEARRHQYQRKTGCAEHILIYCTSGTGWLALDGGQREKIEAGAVAWISSGTAHEYGSSDIQPWTIEWVHFCGPETDDWRAWMGFSKNGGMATIRSVHRDLPPEGRLADIHGALDSGINLQSMLKAAAALRLALVGICQGMSAEKITEPSLEKLRRTEAWMREHLAEVIQVPDLARRTAVSVPHFNTMFRHLFHASPIQHLLQLRLRRGARLLISSDWSVSRIAEACGFADPLYFSRRFKMQCGCSPKSFRLKNS